MNSNEPKADLNKQFRCIRCGSIQDWIESCRVYVAERNTLASPVCRNCLYELMPDLKPKDLNETTNSPPANNVLQ